MSNSVHGCDSFSVWDNGLIRKLAAYAIQDIHMKGYRKILVICVGDNKSSKHWLFIPNKLKKREVKDILIICAVGVEEIKEAAVAVAFPKIEYQC